MRVPRGQKTEPRLVRPLRDFVRGGFGARIRALRGDFQVLAGACGVPFSLQDDAELELARGQIRAEDGWLPLPATGFPLPTPGSSA